MIRIKPRGIIALVALAAAPLAGCVSVKAPERISINEPPARVDSRSVPATRDHEQARQLLAEAYARNRYLEAKVADLQEDKEDLKRERNECKDRYERLKDRLDD